MPGVTLVGSICSGMGADYWALDAIRGYAFERVFWCEKDKKAQEWSRANVYVAYEFDDATNGF
eukprot:1044356-Pyramimonas_sp.AAC.1